MITHFQLKDFKGHRTTELQLKQFTMFVGDNASGKTSALEAMWLQSLLVADPIAALRGSFAPDELRRRGTEGPITLRSRGTRQGDHWGSNLEISVSDDEWAVTYEDESDDVDVDVDDRSVSVDLDNKHMLYRWAEISKSAARQIGTARLYRFEPTKIAASAYSDLLDASIEIDGTQTAVALAALKLGDDEAFDRIEAAMQKLIPSLVRVRVRPAEVARVSKGDTVVGSKIFIDFRGSSGVPAHHASQGTLIVLALLTVLHSRSRPDLILLDDLDHALHPRAQMELVRMIKGLLELDEFQETQIIATTHSPYVLDELAPENVIAFALRDDGTVASKPLTAHPDAAKMKGTLRTGQLWSLDAERDWVLK